MLIKKQVANKDGIFGRDFSLTFPILITKLELIRDNLDVVSDYTPGDRA